MGHDTNSTPALLPTGVNYDLVAAELLKALRGNTSQAAFSRRLGYRSNIAHRWEARKAFPTAARFVRILRQLAPREPSYLSRFFVRVPAAMSGLDPASSEAVAALLRELRGKTPILSIARGTGYNRYSVSRWLNGRADPSLPEFLHLIETLSRRLLDFIACCTDPSRMNSVAASWKRLELTRTLAYSAPWSHAVLRALELASAGEQHQKAWLSDRLGISIEEVSAALDILVRTGQVKKVRGRWRLRKVVNVNTSPDRQRAHTLKVTWTRTALDRMQARAPGDYGYSLFSISRHDMRRLRDLHIEYVRAMQYIIAASQPGECVGLFCAQLLDLAATNNALES